jgi:hypothetical protein
MVNIWNHLRVACLGIVLGVISIAWILIAFPVGDWELTWEELEDYYKQWEDDEWEID